MKTYGEYRREMKKQATALKKLSCKEFCEMVLDVLKSEEEAHGITVPMIADVIISTKKPKKRGETLPHPKQRDTIIFAYEEVILHFQECFQDYTMRKFDFLKGSFEDVAKETAE